MIVASIEARLGSKRLPGKVMADICGAPALTRLLRRLRRAKSLDAIVLATPDEALAEWARGEKLDVFVGSEDDVLGRVVGAHKMMGSDIIVEICGDSPFVDPEVVDMAVLAFRMNDADVVTDTRKRVFPQGVGVQVFRAEALAQLASIAVAQRHREHVSLGFYEFGGYRIIHLAPPPRWHRPDVRLLLDYPEDLEFIRHVYGGIAQRHGDGDKCGLDEILALLAREPHLLDINRMHAQ